MKIASDDLKVIFSLEKMGKLNKNNEMRTGSILPLAGSSIATVVFSVINNQNISLKRKIT